MASQKYAGYVKHQCERAANEMNQVSVALSDFSAFVGFRPPSQIKAFFDSVPEFASIFSIEQREKISHAATSESDSAAKSALKSLFDTAIKLKPDQVKKIVNEINKKLSSGGPQAAFGTVDDSKALADIYQKNAKVYGEDDVGLIVTTFLMNLLQLKAGQGCWILAGMESPSKYLNTLEVLTSQFRRHPRIRRRRCHRMHGKLRQHGVPRSRRNRARRPRHFRRHAVLPTLACERLGTAMDRLLGQRHAWKHETVQGAY